MLYTKGMIIHMEDMIQRILDIDAKASEITAKAEALKTEVKQTIDEKKKQIREEYLAKAQQRIAVVEQMEKEKAQKELAAQQTLHLDALKRLEKIYEKNGSLWVDEIVNRAIAHIEKLWNPVFS